MKYLRVFLFLYLFWPLTISAQDQENSGQTFDDETFQYAFLEAYGFGETRDGIINFSDYWDIIPNSIQPNMANPPYKFFMKQGYQAKRPLRLEQYFTTGQTIDIEVGHCSSQYTIYCFKKNSPSSFSKRLLYTGTSPFNNNHFQETVPSNGVYVVLLIPTEDCSCSLLFNNNRITLQITAPTLMPFTQPNNIECHDFTWNSTNDVELIVIGGSSKCVIAYNDNYNGTGTINWGTEARVSTTTNVLYNYPANINFIIALPKNISGYATTDVYARCEKPYVDDYYGTPPVGNSVVIFNPSFNINVDDFLITYPWINGHAGQGGTFDYNCHAWAGGIWNEEICPTMTVNYDTITCDLFLYDEYYAERGYTREGATEANSDIDVYANFYNGDTIVSHSTIRSYSNGISYGFGWESKNSGCERVMHPRYALAGGPYGQLLARYRKIPNFSMEDITFLNFSFSADELSYIENSVNNLTTDLRNSYEEKYQIFTEKYYRLGLSTTAFLSQIEEYNELLLLLKTTPKTMFLVLNKLSKGEWLAGKLFFDMKYEDNKEIWFDLKNGIKQQNTGLIVTNMSLVTAFAKRLLQVEMNNESDEHKFSINPYCDFSFDVEKTDGSIAIRYTLQKSCRVTTRVDNQYGVPVGILRNGEIMQEGNYTDNIGVPRKGVYVVTISLDGQSYSKKIII